VINIPQAIDRLCYRYPSPLVDAITEHEPGRRIKAVKNVTVNEDFFQGHFPGAPVMPGVLMIETLAQVATILLMDGRSGASTGRAWLRGVDNAKFRLQVVPGDRLILEVTAGPRRHTLARVKAVASINDKVAAEAELVMGLETAAADIHPTAIVHPSARIGAGTVIGPYVTIGERVSIGKDCRIGASCVIDGVTEIGDGNEIFPMTSIGLVPQDLKFGGEPTRVVIGDRNVIREFVTFHRGTGNGGGLTRVGDDNLFMVYSHVAHDCNVGSRTIFANCATLAGHVDVGDDAIIGAFSAVQQFGRVGRHAYLGGYTRILADALPFVKTVGLRPAVFGVNRIGLKRKGLEDATVRVLQRAFRIFLRSGLNTTQALERLETEFPDEAEVRYLVAYVRSARRGVVKSLPTKVADESAVDE
jgi:UDP-N-acetylglucosamine acyltransferase